VRFAAILFASSSLLAAAERPAPYTAVEVDPFVADRGSAFPADYQSALVEDIAREISLTFPTVIILRASDGFPYGHTLLRISGTVTRFKPGDRLKRSMIGFGAGATVVQAQVRFSDATTHQVIMIRQVEGITWTGIAGGDSQAAGESLARKLAKLCSAAHLVEAN